MFAAEIRKRRVALIRGYPQWRWRVDEAFVKVNGKFCYLWRAVDHEGEVLEAVVTAKRDKVSALKLLKRIMKKYGSPRSIVTDGLRAYSAAMNEIGVADRDEVGPRLNNRAESSHRPFRRRERATQRLRSMRTLQKFGSVHAQVHNHFNQERHLVTRQVYKPRCTPDKVKRLKRWEHEGVLDKMQARLDRMPEAMTIRRQTVEHPFGTLKAWMGAAHFLTRTLEKVKTEMSLQVPAYNMKRMINLFGVKPLMPAIAA
jgi:transposase-like protein